MNLYQDFILVVVNFGGVVLSLLLGWLVMGKLLGPDRLAKDARRRTASLRDGPDYRELGHLGTGLSGWVGAIEILLYSSSVVFGHPQFIAVWLGTKYVAVYRTWGKDPVGRTFYNRSLFGTGLNILIGAATGGIALSAMHNQSQWGALWKTGRIAAKGASMLQLVVGAIIAILVTIIVENLRMPRLKLSVEIPPLDQKYDYDWVKNKRTLRVWLSNELPPRWARWMARAAAVQCRATIAFHHLDGQDVFGRPMAGRWSASQEPIPIHVVDLQHVVRFQIVDPERITLESRIDVYAGERVLLDIASRLDDDDNCYGWNNESYFCSPLWRNANWKLERGRYLAKVTVTSSGQKCEGMFRVINDVARTDFRLEPTS